eukprot:7726222-Alexandrium_andersonii.AAC.1
MAAAGAAVRPPQLVDTRLLNKPPVLKGKEAEWATWSFQVKSYLACVDASYTQAVRTIEGCAGGEEDMLKLDNLNEYWRALSRNLYHILA